MERRKQERNIYADALHCDRRCHARIGAATSCIGANLLVGKKLEKTADTHGDDGVVAATAAFESE